jgi:hypothetical protein
MFDPVQHNQLARIVELLERIADSLDPAKKEAARLADLRQQYKTLQSRVYQRTYALLAPFPSPKHREAAKRASMAAARDIVCVVDSHLNPVSQTRLLTAAIEKALVFLNHPTILAIDWQSLRVGRVTRARLAELPVLAPYLSAANGQPVVE